MEKHFILTNHNVLNIFSLLFFSNFIYVILCSSLLLLLIYVSEPIPPARSLPTHPLPKGEKQKRQSKKVASEKPDMRIGDSPKKN